MEYTENINEKIKINEDTLFEFKPIYVKYLLEHKDEYMPWLNTLENINNYDSGSRYLSKREIIIEENLIDKKTLSNCNERCTLTDCSSYRDDDGELYMSSALLEGTVPLYFEGKVYYNVRVWWRLGEICEYQYSYAQDKVVCTELAWSNMNGQCKIYLNSDRSSYKYHSKAELVVMSLLHAIGRDDLIEEYRLSQLKCLTINDSITPSHMIYITHKLNKYNFVTNCILCPNMVIDSTNYNSCMIGITRGKTSADLTLDDVDIINDAMIKDYLVRICNVTPDDCLGTKRRLNNFILTLRIEYQTDKSIGEIHKLLSDSDKYTNRNILSATTIGQFMDRLIELNRDVLCTHIKVSDLPKSMIVRSYVLGVYNEKNN